jgi:hypothetical protein
MRLLRALVGGEGGEDRHLPYAFQYQPPGNVSAAD